MGQEGAEVRKAFDGPTVDHDALIAQLEARIREEHARSSDASESASKVAEFIEDTGVNSQALSWMKSILKKLPKKDGQHKAMDIIRSIKVMLPMIEDHIGGQGTGEMDLDGPQGQQGAEEKPKPKRAAKPKATSKPKAEAKPAEAPDAETEEFNAEVDKVMGEAPGTGKVTPIDFSRGASA